MPYKNKEDRARAQRRWYDRHKDEFKPHGELIQCACGCEESLNKFDHRGRARRFLPGHNSRGMKRDLHMQKGPTWKGGRIKTARGYIMIKKPDHPHGNNSGYVMEHRLVMEAHLGRYLTLEEVIHHINKNLEDNRLENLRLFSDAGSHHKYEWTLRKRDDTT